MINDKSLMDDNIKNKLLHNHFKSLVNQFFKILPMRENEEETLVTYMEGLQRELLGCHSLVMGTNHNPMFLSLLSILQYLIDNPDTEVSVVRKDVFKAISICNKLSSIYAGATEV